MRTLAEILPRQRAAPATGTDNHRTLGTATLQRMEGEGNERKFTLSFSSEEPYERWFGLEILDHAPRSGRPPEDKRDRLLAFQPQPGRRDRQGQPGMAGGQPGDGGGGI